jgi:hypothetical protein
MDRWRLPMLLDQDRVGAMWACVKLVLLRSSD